MITNGSCWDLDEDEDEDDEDQYADEDEYDDEDEENENEYDEDEDEQEDEDEEDDEVASTGHISNNEATLRHVNKILKNHHYYSNSKKYPGERSQETRYMITA